MNNENFDDWTDASQSTDRTVDKSTGEILVGKFLLKQEHIGPNDSNMYHIEVRTGDHTEVVGLWGSAIIDQYFARIPLNSKVRIEYKGQKTSAKSKRTFADYDVKFKAPEGEQKFAQTTENKQDEVTTDFDENEEVSLDDIPFGN